MFNECSTSVQQNKKKSKSKSKSKIENKKNISTSVDLGAFCSSELMPIVEDWLQYKKERNESYKGASGIKAFINNLDLLSDGEPTRARLIINQSMANNWAGIFELKNSQCAAITHDGNLGPSERIENGRRTYGSGRATIPMDAPARPTEQHTWDAGSLTWIIV